MVNPITFKRAIAQTVALPVVLTLLLAGILSWELTLVNRQGEWLTHTNLVIAQAYNTERMFRDRETATRELALLNRPLALPSSQPLDQQFSHLHDLVIDNPVQTARLDSALQLYWSWDANVNHAIRSQQPDSLALYERLSLGNRLNTILYRFTDEEYQLLRDRRQEYRWRTKIVVISSIALTIIIGLFLALLSRRNIRKLTKQYGMAIDEAERNLDLVRTTLLSIEDGIIVTTNAGKVTLINPGATSLTGWRADEVIGRPVNEVFRLFKTDGSNELIDLVRIIINTRHAQNFSDNYYIVSKRRAHIPIDCAASPILDDEGVLAGIVIAFRDVTDRMYAEKELYRRQEEFRALIENAPDPTFRFDRDLKILYANPAAENLLMITADAMIGKAFRDLNLPIETIATWEIQLRNVLSSETGTTTEFEYKGPTGKRRYQMRLVPELNQGGQLETLLATLRDITELKRREQVMRENEERFRAVVESSLDGYYLLRAIRGAKQEIDDFQILYSNLRGAQLLEKQRDVIQSQRLRDVWPEADAKELIVKLSRVIATKEPLEEEIPIENGNRWVSNQIVPLGDDVVLRTSDVSNRRQLEIELFRREEEFRALVEKSPDAIISYDRDLVIRYVNPIVGELLHMDTAEIIGKNYRQLQFPEELTAPWEAAIREAFETKRPTAYTSEFLLPSGETRYFRARNVPEFNQQDEVEMVVTTAHDITDSIRIQQELETQGQLFKAVAENSIEAFFVVRPIYAENGSILDYTFAYANDAGLALLRTSRENISQSTILGLVSSPTLGTGILEQFNTVLGTNTPMRREYLRYKDPERGNSWLQLHAIPIEEAVALIVTDVTERHEVEDQLRNSEQRYRELVENASEAIFSTDLHGNITYVNPYISKLTEYSPEDAAHLNYLNLVTPEYRERAKRQFFRQYLSRQQTLWGEYPFYTKNGNVCWLSLTTTLRYENGEPVGFDCVGVDISQAKQLEFALLTPHRDRGSAEHLARLLKDMKDSLEDIEKNVTELDRNDPQNLTSDRIRNMRLNTRTLLERLKDLTSEV